MRWWRQFDRKRNWFWARFIIETQTAPIAYHIHKWTIARARSIFCQKSLPGCLFARRIGTKNQTNGGTRSSLVLESSGTFAQTYQSAWTIRWLNKYPIAIFITISATSIITIRQHRIINAAIIITAMAIVWTKLQYELTAKWCPSFELIAIQSKHIRSSL